MPESCLHVKKDCHDCLLNMQALPCSCAFVATSSFTFETILSIRKSKRLLFVANSSMFLNHFNFYKNFDRNGALAA